ADGQKTKLGSLFGRQINFIEDGKKYVPKAVEASDYTIQGASTAVNSALEVNAHTHRQKLIQKLAEDDPKVYRSIVGDLTPAALLDLRPHPDWIKAETDQDPVELWRIIKETHLVLGKDDSEQLKILEKKRHQKLFDSFQQGLTMLLAEFQVELAKRRK